MLARLVRPRAPRLARALSVSAAPLEKPVFFDMKCSNNAARIRLWLGLKQTDAIETRTVVYTDLKTREFSAINPLMKVPALIRTDGVTVFESNVILNYLEDKYGDQLAEPRLKPATPEGRQTMELMMRIHDLYIASPNCTQPGFSHSQGSMYLSTGWHGPARGMDAPTRAAKLAEMWRQLNWLEAHAGAPYLVPCTDHATLADLTWFPTAVFMEYMLPRNFGWPDILNPAAPTPFPKLAAWYAGLRAQPHFAECHADIWSYWEKMDAAGQFGPIREEVAAHPHLKYTYGVPQAVPLNYQQPPPAGKQTGRYIDQPDKGDVEDVHQPCEVWMHNGRELQPAATLASVGFALESAPSQCADFTDHAQVESTYYDEMIELIKRSSGADRVLIFDHTIRESGNQNLNASAGATSAAPVPRVHCDYTADGAPRRMQQLGTQGIYSRLRGRDLTEAEVAQLKAGRFAFINVWRSIDDVHPVLQQPLAVCDERSVAEEDRFLYELRFPNRTGENYSLRHSDAHRWYYYPQMRKDEALVFKVYDKKEDGPRFVFHTAFTDPSSPADAPQRKSIEVRGIAFFDVPWASEA